MIANFYFMKPSNQLLNSDHNFHLRKIFFIFLLSFCLFSEPLMAIEFDEGIDYKVIENKDKKGVKAKFEVVEFFWYGCPHCRSLAPALDEWKKKLPKKVSFVKLHVPFREINHQRMFFALENIGLEEKLHFKIFDAIHIQGLQLVNFLDILSWVESHGIDEKQFEDSWNSKKVQSSMKNATKLMHQYKIDGVPQMVVNGTYLTSPYMVGGNHKRVLKVVDYLLNKK